MVRLEPTKQPGSHQKLSKDFRSKNFCVERFSAQKKIGLPVYPQVYPQIHRARSVTIHTPCGQHSTDRPTNGTTARHK